MTASAELQREQRRRQALQAMGVVELVPRFVLPGAAPSPQAPVLPTAAPERAGEVAPPPSVEPPVHQRPDPAPRPARPAAASPDRSPTARAVPLSLALCRAGAWLVMEAGPAPNRPYQRLLANVLHSCGLGGVSMEVEHFLWPPPGRLPPHLDASSAGSEVFSSRLQALHQRQPLERVLRLGDGLPMLPDGLAELESLAVPVGLWTALEQPEAKRQLWLALADAGWLA